MMWSFYKASAVVIATLGFPSHLGTAVRLSRLLARYLREADTSSFTFQSLLDRTKTDCPAMLALMLDAFRRRGWVSLRFHVMAADGTSLGNFLTIGEIPDRLADEIVVPDQIRVAFSVPGNSR